jgi:microcin C transport system ATP-binding protein
MTGSNVAPLLDVRGLSVAFGGKQVVHGIDFQIGAGEKLALVGESGSGKTVSALSLLRLLPQAAVQGQALLEGRDLLAMPADELLAVRGTEVAMIFQEPMTALNPLMTVGDQVAEVLEQKMGLAPVDAAQRAINLLADTGIADPARRARSFPHQLSGGQRQRAMIAMALACRPKLLLADEPTTALDVTVRGQILDLLTELQRTHGLAVLLITHDLNLVRRFADRIAVMERGRLVETGSVHEVFAQPRHAYTRQLLDSRPQRNVLEAQAPGQAPVVQARGLRVTYPIPRPGWRGWLGQDQFVALHKADFTLHPGRTLGVVGESGSGKSTLAMAALGLVASSGHLEIQGQTWPGTAAAQKPMRRIIQVVFQDPFSSLSPRMTVEELVGEGLRVHAAELSPTERRRRVVQALADVGLTEDRFPHLLERYPQEFSGGQRQRVAIARALIVGPEVLVLDEPTSALDVTIQHQILELLQRLQRERGLSYLLITHDMEVIRAMAHDVLVMKDGDVVESGPVMQVLDAPQQAYTRALVVAAA